MNDTPPEVDALYRELLLAKGPAERLRMACSMHETARQMALAGIRMEAPETDEVELTWKLFLRVYGEELSDAVKEGFRKGLLAWEKRRQPEGSSDAAAKGLP